MFSSKRKTILKATYDISLKKTNYLCRQNKDMVFENKLHKEQIHANHLHFLKAYWSRLLTTINASWLYRRMFYTLLLYFFLSFIKTFSFYIMQLGILKIFSSCNFSFCIWFHNIVIFAYFYFGAAAQSSGDVSVNDGQQIQQQKKTSFTDLGPLKDTERRDLNCAVKEYLLIAGYRLTAMTFYEEVGNAVLLFSPLFKRLVMLYCFFPLSFSDFPFFPLICFPFARLYLVVLITKWCLPCCLRCNIAVWLFRFWIFICQLIYFVSNWEIM